MLDQVRHWGTVTMGMIAEQAAEGAAVAAQFL
jgi:hypothetical protein